MLRFLSLLLLAAPLFGQQLTFATYAGGSGTESSYGIVQDFAGNVYLAGTTNSTDFPKHSAAGGGFVIKLNAAGTQQASFLYPGLAITGIAIDASGNLVVTGSGTITPTTGAYTTPQATGFVSQLNSSLIPQWTSTFAATPQAIAIDASRNIYVAGTASNNFATTPGVFQTVNKGATDAFVLKLSFDGTTALYATYLGGSADESAYAIAVDSLGDVFLTGATGSSDFPLLVANAAQKQFGGLITDFFAFPSWYGDAFVAKFDPKGTTLLYSTYLGGAAADQGNAITVDGNGNAYVGGGTESATWLAGPATGAYQPAYAGPVADPDSPYPSGDAFVAKLTSSGVLAWYTYLGGANHDAGSAIALDKSGNIYLAGNTDSPGFAKAGSGLPDCHIGGRPFLAEFDPTGGKLLLYTGMPGIGFDQVYSMAFDAAHSLVYLAGDVASEVFFATPGAAQSSFAGGDADSFVARIDLTQQTQLAVGCVLNGASFLAGNTTPFPTGAVAPGEIVSLFGVGLGPAGGQNLQLAADGSVAKFLGGMQVFFDGIPAALLYAGSGQINAVVPYGINSNQTQMTVKSAALTAGPISMPVVAVVPAIFTYDGSGTGQAAALNPDYSFNTVATPVTRGTYITFYACGVGLMSSNVDGAVTPGGGPYPSVQLPVTVSIRGVDAQVLFAGAAPGFVAGLLQVNVVVPAGVDFGDHIPLQLKVGTVTSQASITIAAK